MSEAEEDAYYRVLWRIADAFVRVKEWLRDRGFHYSEMQRGNWQPNAFKCSAYRANGTPSPDETTAYFVWHEVMDASEDRIVEIIQQRFEESLEHGALQTA